MLELLSSVTVRVYQISRVIGQNKISVGVGDWVLLDFEEYLSPLAMGRSLGPILTSILSMILLDFGIG